MACNKDQPQPLTKLEIQQKIDSLTNIRVKELDQMAQIDLDHRIKIEVKVKVDSILNARFLEQRRIDSATNSRLQAKVKDTAANKGIITK